MDQCDEIFNVMKLDWSFLVSSSGSYLADPKITQSGRQVGLGLLFYEISTFDYLPTALFYECQTL